MVLQSDIMKFSAQSDQLNRSIVVAEAMNSGRQTAFLSHSHQDMELVKRIQPFLMKNGWNVYVDWADNSMPATTSPETASKIKKKIIELDWFLFLATQKSMDSKWCPWEIGYADGVKDYSKILIIPTTDGYSRTYGSEYIDLYKRITSATSPSREGFGVFAPKQTTGGPWINTLQR